MTQEKGHPDDQRMLDLLRARYPAIKALDDRLSSKERETIEVISDFELINNFSLTNDPNDPINDPTIPGWKRFVLKTLVENAEIEKRLRKFRPPDPREPWLARWLAVPIAQIFLSEDQREEWLGDLREENRKLMRDGYPAWMLNGITFGKTIRILLSSIDIKIIDFILKLRGKI